jgi:hypothetical protein
VAANKSVFAGAYLIIETRSDPNAFNASCRRSQIASTNPTAGPETVRTMPATVRSQRSWRASAACLDDRLGPVGLDCAGHFPGRLVGCLSWTSVATAIDFSPASKLAG